MTISIIRVHIPLQTNVNLFLLTTDCYFPDLFKTLTSMRLYIIFFYAIACR